VVEILREINLGGTGVVVATHDPLIAEHARSRLIRVAGGRVREAPRMLRGRRRSSGTVP